jgi:dihydroceramidase
MLIHLTDIALVEYLTSDDAGKPLGGRFAWPVGLIVTSKAVSGSYQNGSAVKAKEMNGKKS